LARLERLLAERGRHRDDVTVSICPNFKAVDRAAMERYQELGVDRVILVVLAMERDQLLTVLDHTATELLEPVVR
jgi:hypothetical protein